MSSDFINFTMSRSHNEQSEALGRSKGSHTKVPLGPLCPVTSSISHFAIHSLLMSVAFHISKSVSLQKASVLQVIGSLLFPMQVA